MHDFHYLVGLLGSAHVDADHAAKAVAFVHHAAGELVIYMLGQAGIVVLEAHLFETFGQIHGVAAVLLHADMEGVEVFEDAGAAHGVEYGAEQHGGTVVHIDEAVDVVGRATDGTGNAVVLTVHKLGHAVDNHVGTQTVGAEYHGGEGVVHQQTGTVLVSYLAQFGQIGDAQQGVVHGLGVEHLGVGAYGGLHVVQFLEVDEGDFHVVFLQPVVEEGEGAAVGGHAGHNVVAAVHFVQQSGGDGCHAGAGAPGCFGAFHGCQSLAECHGGGVPMTAVEEETFGLAVERVGHQLGFGEIERGGVVNRRVHTTVGVVGAHALDSGSGIEFAHTLLI